MRYRKLPNAIRGKIRRHYEYSWRRTTVYVTGATRTEE